MISITQSAVNQINTILDNHPGKLLKVGVKGGGCSGFTYAMDIISEEEILLDDERIVDNGIEIILDGVSIMYLIGTELDYKVDIIGAQFVFNNPAAKSQCGCGTSFSI